MPQKTHTMHGRDHCPDGADPIPCLPPGSPVGGDFEGVVLELGPIGYWRLGETAAPFADTSGYNPGNPADLTSVGSGAAPTPDVTGALTAGQDDGALEFNYDGALFSGGRAVRETLIGADVDRFYALVEMTICAWVKTKTSAATRRGHIIGNAATVIGSPNWVGGYSLQIHYPGRTVRFSRGQDGGSGSPEIYATTATGLTVGEWVFVVGTFDGTAVRLYMNGTLEDTTAHVSAAPASSASPLWVGTNDLGDSSNMPWFYGTVDEAAVWDRALTPTEIAALYDAGVGTGSGAGGEVLLSDGAGGTTWGKVTSLAIENETIVDADVSPTAAVDVSKLAAGTDGYTLQTVGGEAVWAATSSGDPSTDTLVWMPLTTVTGGVPELVWEASNDLIPTLVPL